jgi:signal transduction histidine kinase/integral membrane sensor domain MASE1
MRFSVSRPVQLGLLALAYFVSATLGLGLSVPGTDATTIWLPTGLAIAAVLRLGPRVWPAILLGALAANGLFLARLGLPVAPLLGTALDTALGNTAEALLAGLLIRRVTGTHDPFDRVAHVMQFLLLGVILAPLLSAVVGTASFCAATGQWRSLRAMGTAWWLGDATGALVVVPLLLTFRRKELAALPWAVHRDALVAGALVLAFWFGVCPLLPPMAVIFFPLLVLGTFRLGPFYASVLVALLAALATIATVLGVGPFILPGSRYASLLLQQGFIATLAITSLVLAAALHERRTLEARLLLHNRLYRTQSGVNQAIVHATDRVALLGEACRLLVELGGFRMAWVGFKDEAAGRLVPVASAGHVAGYLDDIVIRWDDTPEGRGPSGRAIREGRGVIFRDCPHDPGFAPWRARALARGYQTACVFPIRQGGAVSSVLMAFHGEPDAIGLAEGRLLEELAGDLGYALEALGTRTELGIAQEGVAQRATQLAALNEVSTRLSTTLDLGACAHAALEGILAATSPDLAQLFLREGAELRLLEAMAGPGGPSHEQTPVHRVGQCLCGLGAQEGRALYSIDIAGDLRCTLDECKRAGIRSFAVLPLNSGDAVIGVLGLASASRRDFAAQSTFLETLASQVATGIQNALLHQRLQAHARDLERSVEERTALLREANEELALAVERTLAADRAKSAFLSAMSHELRTPLNSVIGFTGVLLKGMAGELQPRQVEPLRIVQRNGRHLLELINDVLDLSKIEAAEMRLAALPFDLVQTAREALESMAPAAAAKGLVLGHAFAVEALPLTGDRRRVVQILLNLLSNAVKFTLAGRVDLRLTLDAGLVRIAVEDTGPGIAQQDIPRLFREFEQLDTGLARHSEGTGLGLALSRRLARLMKGTITVESQPGRGSTFTLILPSAGGSA